MQTVEGGWLSLLNLILPVNDKSNLLTDCLLIISMLYVYELYVYEHFMYMNLFYPHNKPVK